MQEDLKHFLLNHTNIQWTITMSNEGGVSLKENLALEARQTKLWYKLLETFPEAKITDILLKKPE